MAVTNADRTETIRWYQKHYDYRQLGTLNKLCDFSLSDVDCSTTLEMDLEDWMRLRPARGARRNAFVATTDPHPLALCPSLVINTIPHWDGANQVQQPPGPVAPRRDRRRRRPGFRRGDEDRARAARDERGEPTPDARLYERIVTTIRRERRAMICCVTTPGRDWRGFAQRAEVLHSPGSRSRTGPASPWGRSTSSPGRASTPSRWSSASP